MTLNRQNVPLAEIEKFYGAHQKHLNEDRPKTLHVTDIFVTWPCSSWTLRHDNWHSFIIIIIIIITANV